MIAVRTYEEGRTYVPMMLAYLVSRSQLNGTLGMAVAVMFWLYSGYTVYGILIHWSTRQFAFDGDGIRYRSGLFSRVEVSLPWSSVAALEIHEDPVRRLADCCSVTVRASAGADAEITLAVVRRRLADEIRRVSGLPVSESQEQQDDAGLLRDAADRQREIFSASNWDLVVMSLAYGRFALFVPFVIGTYSDVSDAMRLPDPEWLVTHGLSGTLADQLIWIAAVTLVSVVYGCLATLFRFWKFRASIVGDSLLLQGGLLVRQQRAIPLDRVIGVVLRRNTFELLTGRGRLALLTRDSGQVLGKNVVLPALPMSEIQARKDAIGADFGELLVLDGTRMRMGRVWWIAAGRILSLVSSFALVLTAFGLWRHCVAAAVLLIPLCVVVVNGCFTVLDRDSSGERVLYRRGVIWRSSFSLPLAEVQVFRSDTWPWDRWIGLRRVSLYYFAGGARRLFAWQAARPSTSIATIGFE
jgi:uncharacterized membrane protein YdbT with pleckstrin-like domain